MIHGAYPTMIFAFSGPRRVGKDTACALLMRYLDIRRYAFANALKSDLAGLIYNQFNIDVFTMDNNEKEHIRPLLIAYGSVWRDKDPLHWVNIVIDSIKTASDTHAAVTDVRFENELDELVNVFGSDLIHIDVSNTCPSCAPTPEEEKHYRRVSERAKYRITWGGNTMNECDEIVKSLYRQIMIDRNAFANQ